MVEKAEEQEDGGQRVEAVHGWNLRQVSVHQTFIWGPKCPWWRPKMKTKLTFCFFSSFQAALSSFTCCLWTSTGSSRLLYLRRRQDLPQVGSFFFFFFYHSVEGGRGHPVTLNPLDTGPLWRADSTSRAFEGRGPLMRDACSYFGVKIKQLQLILSNRQSELFNALLCRQDGELMDALWVYIWCVFFSFSIKLLKILIHFHIADRIKSFTGFYCKSTFLNWISESSKNFAVEILFFFFQF